MLKVAKFGGTSLANAAAFARVRDIVKGDAGIKYVVASAPGKRFEGDAKVTDLIIMKKYDTVKDRFSEIAAYLGIAPPDFPENMMPYHGEMLCAKMLAEYLSMPYAEAGNVFNIAEGTVNVDILPSRAVLGGFYGNDGSGGIITFPRGGSDISGAYLAAAAGADAYENWTDVSGIFTADPRANPDAEHIKYLTYDEAIALCGRGANVLHADAIAPCARAGVPIHVKNTFFPADFGSLIR